MAEPKGYGALRTHAAWRDVSNRGKIRVTGEDRARLLHAMTTNHVEQLKPGEGCYAYFLSAQGRILSDVHILCQEEFFFLDTEPETRDKVFEHLDRFIIADDVTLAAEAGLLTTIALAGLEGAAVLRSLGATIPENPEGNTIWKESMIAAVSLTGGPGYVIISPKAQGVELVESLRAAGVEEGSEEAFEIVRLEHGLPRYGADLSERFLAQEANQARALNFNKGCYLGQEIVERVRSRGQVHRLLMPLAIEGTEVPEAGTKITEGGANLAEITSAAYSPALGHVAALAYVRSDKAKPGVELKLDGRMVRVGRPYSPGADCN